MKIGYEILDVGGGANPRIDADVIVDISESWKGEKHEIPDGAEFVLADVEDLPFRDNSFSFSYALHVVEHTDNPERALDEISRVSRRGYVETPSPIWELLRDSPNHNWLIWNEGDVLFIREKGMAVSLLQYLPKIPGFSIFGDLARIIGWKLTRFYWEDEIKCVKVGPRTKLEGSER